MRGPRIRTVVTALLLTTAASTGSPAHANGEPPVSDPHIVAHFDINASQTPENIALEPDGSADLTFSLAAQVAHVSLDGHTRILSTLPSATNGTCPIVGLPAATFGLTRSHRGDLYVVLCTGSADLQGIWRLRPGDSPVRVAALDPHGLPNGSALDECHQVLYVADSVLGKVWRVSLRDGHATEWASGPALAPTAGFGANGLKLHDGAVWVGNTDQGTLLRIPIEPDGTAGPATTVARGLVGIDDFAFESRRADSPVIAGIYTHNKVVRIRQDGTVQTLLTAADGLSTPTAIAVRGHRLYVADAAYTSGVDPNLLVAHLNP